MRPRQGALGVPWVMHHVCPWRWERLCRSGHWFQFTVQRSAVSLFPSAHAFPTVSHGSDHGRQAAITSGEQGLNHAPAITFRTEFNPFGFQPFRQTFQPFLRFWSDALPLERCLGFWNKRAHPEGEPQPFGVTFQCQKEFCSGFDVVIGFGG